MIKIFLFSGILLFSILSCQKEDDRILLNATFFEFNDCFSSASLTNQEIVITNLNSYQVFEDDIRRHFFVSCDTINLPEIDFENNFFVGKYTSAGGCDISYSRQIYYNMDRNIYDYEISLTPVGDCEMLLTSFNCAIVPIQSDSIKVNFEISKP